MGSPAGPIYASTLHRRDRAWRLRRRGLWRMRAVAFGGAAAALATVIVQRLG
jgi:hypothetical protein